MKVSWPIAAFDEFFLEPKQLWFLLKVKSLYDRPLSFASLGLASGQEEIVPGDHLAPKMIVPFHEAGLPRAFSQPPICDPTCTINSQEWPWLLRGNAPRSRA